MTDPFQVVRDFEAALCEYTGARYAVTTTSCSMALLLACAWELNGCESPWITADADGANIRPVPFCIPKRTYISVPMSIIHAGGKVTFRDEDWLVWYQLAPYPIWDAARTFAADMYCPGDFQCVSFHWNKPLGIQQGGAILHDDPKADVWLRRARFDGRTEGVAPKDDTFDMIGWHCYMAPETAAAGLVRLANLPDTIPDMPNDDYPDLSKMEIFG